MPDFHFWFTGTALYLSTSFAFAIAVGLIGIKDMIPRRLFYILLAAALVLSGLAWRTAAQQERDAHEQSATNAALNNKLDAVSLSLQKIASKSNVDPNQSAQTVADAIIKHLDAMQAEIKKTSRDVENIKNPPHKTDFLYQNGAEVGEASGVLYNGENVRIGKIENGLFNFGLPIEFNGDKLICQRQPMLAGTLNMPGHVANSVYVDVYCHIMR